MDKRRLELCFEQGKDLFISEWKALLRFPSVSSDPAHAPDCQACAEWLTAHLRDIGFESRLLPTSSRPIVYAERAGSPGKPVVLLYGHYDVQPVDPPDLWNTSPFEPMMRGDRLYARGAQDNKGQTLYVLKAIQTLIRAGAEIPTIKILLEGEEESGSVGIAASLPAWREMIRANVLMVCDTSVASSGAPAIIMGLRGIVHLTFTLSGPAHDLHSGVHGGVAPNPAAGMARLISTFHHDDGRIAVKGFYDSVLGPTDEERSLANALPFDPERYRAQTGVPPLAGEPGFSPAERLSFRPSLDVNGLHSGYGGPGTKTIIPALAVAKISARLAAGQDPERCLEAIITHLTERTPPGLKLGITERSIGGAALRVSLRSPLIAKARAVLAELSDKETAFVWEGASIPILSRLAELSRAEPLLVGQGCEEDNIHAPNESFSIEQFKRGYIYAGLLLSRL